jgi:type IV secretory pathway VirJ component
MQSMAQQTLQLVMADPAVETTLTMVAAMVGAPRDTVTRTVASGLPLMADVADGDPWVFKAMYAQSIKHVPEPTQGFYAKLGKNAAARRALAADFKRMYGPMTETINRDAASLVGASEEQTSQILAATMPAVVRAVGKANTNRNEMGFGRQLRNLQA